METVAFICALFAAACLQGAEARVTSISPRVTSLAGETRITIWGTGFSANQFNHGVGNSHLGNKVIFTNDDGHSVTCDIDKDGSTEVFIVCVTRPDMLLEVLYMVYVTVDGVPDTLLCTDNVDRCKIKATEYNTPTLSSIEPQSGIPGELILTAKGRIITSRFGSNTLASINGIEAMIVRVYAGSRLCQLKFGDNEGDFFGLEIDNERSTEGYMICKPDGTFIGNFRLTFIIEEPFGRSLADLELMKASAQGILYTIQTYTVINSIGPGSGSDEGGTWILIEGPFYEDSRDPDVPSTYLPAEVYVGDVPCLNIEVSKDPSWILCETPPKQNAALFKGGRGVLIEVWNNPLSISDFDNAANSIEAPDTALVMDYTKYCADDSTGWVRMSGIFVAPDNGRFRFSIKAPSGGKLYINDAPVSTSTGGWDDTPEELDLVKYQSLHLIAVAELGTDECIEVRVAHLDTMFTPKELGKNAYSEVQAIKLTSTVVLEQQHLVFSGVSSVSEVHEVQQVCKTGGGNKIRLGLYKTFTGPADFEADSVKESLLTMPFLDKSIEDFTVVVASDPNCLDITFNSPRGNIPTIEVHEYSDVQATVEILTEGVASEQVFSFQFNGVPSPLIAYNETDKDAFAGEMEAALDTMFSVVCPDIFMGAGSNMYEGFEKESGNANKFGDDVVTSVSPFCGRHSIKNHEKIFPVPYDNKNKHLFSINKVMCFAVKDLVYKETIYMIFKDSDNKRKSANFPLSLTEIGEHGWEYTCLDLFKLFTDKWPTETPSQYALVLAQLTANAESDFYVDNIQIGKEELMKTLLETTGSLGPAYPNSDLQFTIESVTVAHDVDNGHYTVTMTPHDCGYDFDKLSLDEAQSGASMTLTVTQETQASRPIAGTFRTSFNGKESANIDAQDSDSNIRIILTDIDDIGNIEVESTEVSSCDNRDIRVKFESRPGAQEMLIISDDSLLADPVSQVNIERMVTGRAFYAPIRGDMVSTAHTKPQVRVLINGIPSKCNITGGSECVFEWRTEDTPTVTGVDPTSGGQGTELTITGTLFSSTAGDNTVLLGFVPCTVTEATDTQVKCTVGNVPLGIYPIRVHVDGKGIASSATLFQVTAAGFTFSPVQASLGGQIPLVITGQGFTDTSNVTIDGVECPILTIDAPNSITCTIPSYTDLTVEVNQPVDVQVNIGDTTLSGSTDFTYTFLGGVEITSVTPQETLTVTGGQLIDIVLTSQGATTEDITLGGVMLEVISRTDQALQVKTPSPMINGEALPLVVLLGTDGAILDATNAIPTLDIKLKVTNVFPKQASLYGGTTITLTGEGFGTVDDDVTVNVGDSECAIVDTTDTQILCDLPQLFTSYDVDNTGDNGYFAWSATNLQIEQGDIIKFKWDAPDFLNDVQYGVYQTASLTEGIMEGGFSSGPQTRTGSYDLQIKTTGTFYFWSDYADKYKIKSLRIRVDSVAKADSMRPVRVTVNGIEAEYDTTSGVADPVDSSGCSLVDSDITGCTPQTLTPDDSSLFNIHFDACRSPVVKNISFPLAVPQQANSATYDTEITVTGTGFSMENCSNIAMIDGCPCQMFASTSTSFKCKPDSSCNHPVAKYLPISLLVDQYGYALFEISSLIAFVPEITEISPTKGSGRGGTKVTITGSGFADLDSITATFNGISAECIDINPLVCVSPYSTESTNGNITITVGQVVALCSGSCVFEYDSTITPSLSTVSPTQLSSTTQLTIQGTGFGSDSALITITIGGEDCHTVVEAADTTVKCTMEALPAADNIIELHVAGVGSAIPSPTVTGVATVTSITPTSGSVHGGTNVTIIGHGFTDAVTKVKDGDNNVICSDLAIVDLVTITCTTVANPAAEVNFIVKADVTFSPPVAFTYADADTPTINTVDPTTGSANTLLTINGANFGSDVGDITVRIGNSDCTGVSVTNTDTITCTTGDLATGDYDVQVHVAGKGLSNSETFTYEIVISGISPLTGASIGNQMLTISGSGFSASLDVEVCATACLVVEATPAEIKCLTPANTDATTCNIMVSDGNTEVVASDQYTYAAGLAPTLTSVSPIRGGTGGGTRITLAGTSLSGSDDPTVSIDGVDCPVHSFTGTEIVCDTEAHAGTIQANVVVTVDGKRSNYGDYLYVDAFSSTATWGGDPVPGKGEMVVIPAGKVILIDQTTEVLAMILVDGGELILDDAPITLNAQRILINNGGRFTAGTEDKPILNGAKIMLWGHHRNEELPIYGTKNLAVRNGHLNLHGKPIENPWTMLAATARAGDTTIQVQDTIDDWSVGDEIVIATTGHKFSTHETEKRAINAISGKTITLDSALAHKHLGEVETFTGVDGQPVELDYGAEVGLLSRTLIVTGNQDSQWDRQIEKCPAGFDPGEFVTQTCFEGRFGEEKGSSQFGGQIIVHGSEKDTQNAQAHISYTEVTFMGQAFRLGRYPIHFHLNGDMSQSYVKGCAIYHTFNRAINIHGSHNVEITKNVAYNVMGGAFFLEDGIETNNTFAENLGVFVKSSTSLLNDDITPATFWVTHPGNTLVGNHAAGGTHFGYWYRMHDHPDGPSYTTSVCPRREPLQKFQGNVAHSFGWFGLWMFQEYYPVKDGSCNGGTPEPALFEDFVSWNNEKGVEFVTHGSLQLIRATLVQNALAGVESKQLKDSPRRDAASPMVNDTLIVGQSSIPDVQNELGAGKAGVIFPFGDSFQVHNTRFEMFPSGTVALKFTSIDGVCKDQCGGFTDQVSGLQWGTGNVDRKIHFRWVHEAVIEDIDGSLCGTPGASIIPEGTIPDNSDCTPCVPEITGVITPMVCQNMRFHRLAFNGIKPSSLEGKTLNADSHFMNGTSRGPYRTKRVSHKPGWMVILRDRETYTLTWENAETMTNVSFSARLDEFREGDCNLIRLRVAEKPDVASINGADVNASDTSFDCTTAGLTMGSWTYGDDGFVTIAIIGPPGPGVSNLNLNLVVNKCFFTNCIPPRNPETDPPAPNRPSDAVFWSDNIWTIDAITGVYTVSAKDTDQDPPPNALAKEDIIITSGVWVVIREPTTLVLGTVKVEAANSALELDFESDSDYSITMDFLVITAGRFVVGWPNNPMKGNVNIILAGSLASPTYGESESIIIGAKAIGVFGGLDVHGKDESPYWYRLAETAEEGSDTIRLDVTDGETIKWQTDGELFLTSTSNHPKESERHTIKSITGNEIKLKDKLQYTHQVVTEIINGVPVLIGGAVGLLTRSIVIEGQQNSGEYFGGRIVASVMQDGDIARRGYISATHTQLKHMGQDGFTESYDPRYALAFVATGTVDEVKPSIVYGCSFDTLFGSAIGLYGASGMNIEDNVVYKPLGNGIITTSDDTNIVNNLVSDMQWTGAFDGREEKLNTRYEGGINVEGGAKRPKLQGNYVSGSERVGFRVSGALCSNPGAYANNTAFGNLMGVAVFPEDNIIQEDGQKCVSFNGFTVVKNIDYGIYYNGELIPTFSDNIFTANKANLFPMVIGPNPVPPKEGVLDSEKCSHDVIRVEHSTFIGYPTGWDCSTESSAAGTYLRLSAHCRGLKGPNEANLGLVFPQFTGGKNNAPEKPCAGIMSYNTLCGKMIVNDVEFRNFHDTVNGCPASIGISSSTANDDLQHPIDLSGITLTNVIHDNRVIYTRPNVDKVDPSNCVDMDCDALKKLLIRDLDGSFLESPGSIISQSEWEWGGDARRGLSDVRVPKDMLTELDGSTMTVNQLAPNGKGISRSGNCQLVTIGNLAHYECLDTDYEMMVFESLDADTEKRRLSPVAVLEDGYIDLINGPQDHGWCNGYTCQERVSAFHSLVRPGDLVTVYLSSLQPEKMRFFLLDAASDSCVVVSFYYLNPNRIDVYTRSHGATTWNYIIFTNGEMRENDQMVIKNEEGVDYMPTCAHPHGTNYIDRNSRLLYFVLKGTDQVLLRRKEVVIVSFGLPTMTNEDFFASDIIENLAAMLNIDLQRVRVVEIIRETVGNRKRRSADADTMKVIFEIGPAPSATAEEDGNGEEAAATQAARSLMDSCQEGSINSQLDTEGLTCDTIIVQDDTYTPSPPDSLFFHAEHEPQHEGVPFAIQPKIRAYDTEGNIVGDLGIEQGAWEMTATLRAGTGHVNAVLGGTLTVASSNGWFNFTDLAISHAENDYIIDFEISAPASAIAMNLSLSTAAFDVAKVPMSARVYAMTTADIEQDAPFDFTLELIDETTNEPIPDIAWRNHVFYTSCEALTAVNNLTGVLNKNFDAVTEHVAFTDIAYTGYGFIYVACRIVSTPAEFNFNALFTLVIRSPSQVGMVIEATNIISVRYNLDYDTTLPTAVAAAQLHQLTIENFVLWYPDVIISSSTISRGSIVITFTIQGNTGNVTKVTNNICQEISNGLSVYIGALPVKLDGYMTVDGENVYESCRIKEDEPKGLHPAYIALIAVGCLLIIAIIVLVLLWKFKIRPKSRTHGITKRYSMDYADNGRTVFLAGAHQKVEDIFNKQTANCGLRPESAAPITTLYDETPGYLNIRKSPIPEEALSVSNRNRQLTPPTVTGKVQRPLTPTGD